MLSTRRPNCGHKRFASGGTGNDKLCYQVDWRKPDRPYLIYYCQYQHNNLILSEYIEFVKPRQRCMQEFVRSANNSYFCSRCVTLPTQRPKESVSFRRRFLQDFFRKHNYYNSYNHQLSELCLLLALTTCLHT